MTSPPPPELHAVTTDAVVTAANAAAHSRRVRTTRLPSAGNSRARTVELPVRDLQHFAAARRRPQHDRDLGLLLLAGATAAPLRPGQMVKRASRSRPFSALCGSHNTS